MKKTLFILFTAVLGLAVFTSPVPAQDTIRLAYIDPLTGAFANVGDAGLKHFEYMAERINENGGILGKKLEIVPFDNKTNPKESLIQLQRAIDQGIQFITQGNGSSVAGALIEAVNKHNKRYPDERVLYFNYAAVTPAFTNEKCSFWHFRFDFHVDMKINAITNFIKEQRPDIKKIYLINMDYVFGHSVSDAANRMIKEKRPDIEIVGDTFHPLGKVKDFSPYVSKIQASGADAVITGNWGNDMSLLIKAAESAGLKSDFFTFYGGGLGTPTAVGKAGKDRIYQVIEWHNALAIEEDKPEDEKFYLRFQKEYAKDSALEWYYGRIRTMMQMVQKAFEEAGKAEPEAVARALEGMTHETLYGTATMRAEDHQLNMPLYIAKMVEQGTHDAKYDVENTGMGWTTVGRVEAEDVVMPTTCDMKRP
ncbi:MAG: branched-chain amino acid ABC transporter substrate-binding protein [Desulfobacterales bacterium]|nr:branched-chain amino acid ABC transporter substrate-binding protein [Desulfobacterales bacterium]MBS3755266.1 branched-chain amino acid ABC transporter substrate-binding protein [Desulfobacterales bacterium]